MFLQYMFDVHAQYMKTKRLHITVLFSSFQNLVTLNGLTHRKLEPHCISKQTAPHESTVQ